MHNRRRHKHVLRMTNMRISSTHTQKQQRNTYQQNLKLNLESHGRYWRLKKKRADVKIASKCNKKNPTSVNSLKLKKAQNEFASIYLNEQTEYIQNQIDMIRNSVEDRKSRIARQTINEVSRRNRTAKAKLKDQQEQIKLWKQHFQNLQETHQKLHMNQSRKLLVSS